MAQAQMRLEMLANHYNPSGLGFGSCSSFKPLFVMAMREGTARNSALFPDGALQLEHFHVGEATRQACASHAPYKFPVLCAVVSGRHAFLDAASFSYQVVCQPCDGIEPQHIRRFPSWW
jgi:hypothetical protein